MSQWKNITHFAALDWASQRHEAVVIDRDGNITEEFAFDHSADGWTYLRRRIAKYTHLAFAVESGMGIVVEQLLSTHALVFVVPAKNAKAYRERRVSGSKTDRIDALSLARALRSDGHEWKPAQPLDPIIEQLRLLCRDEVALIQQRTRLVNQLRAALREYYPIALEAFNDWTTTSSWAFIEAFPTPEALAKAGRKRWEHFLHKNKLWRNNVEARLETFARAKSFVGNEAVTQAKSLLALSLVRMLTCVEVQINEYRKRIEQLYAEHPDHNIFDSLPGAGERLGPRLLAEMGEDRDVFPDANALQCYSGTAPVSYQSGQMHKVMLRRSCNKELRAAVHLWSQQAILRCPWAKIYYKAQRKRGKSHSCALRCLGNRLTKILWRIWQNHATYNADVHTANQIKHGSWVVQISPATP
ncbi:MAG: IS110 family transposase [Puniceicoccales bacterium]